MMNKQVMNARYIWMDGEFVLFEEAMIHVMSPCACYGINVFEGIRAYWNKERKDLYCFRLRDHYVRLAESMKIMRLQLPYTVDDNILFLLETLRKNELREDVHIRQKVLVSGMMGGFSATEPVSMFIAAMLRGRIFDLEKGIRCCISSWSRPSDNSIPPRVKAGANYQNARLTNLWAHDCGFDEAIILNERGKVAEAPDSCLFLVRKGVLVTPPVSHGILESITRETIICLARQELGRDVVQREIDRTELYVAEEVFLCGSAVEIVPVISVDNLPVGTGKPGPMTRQIQDFYFDIVRGNNPKYSEWFTPTYE